MAEQIEITYESIKELHDQYLLEYSPPNKYTKMAIISLTIRYNLPQSEVAALIENEAKIWIERYPITTMTSAFHENEDLIDLTSCRDSSGYVCYFDDKGSLLLATWKPNSTPDKTFYYPDDDPSGYFRQQKRIKRFDRELLIKKHKKQILSLKLIAVAWGAIIPAIYEISNYAGPKWISLLACVYGLYKALSTGLKAWGIIPESKSKREKQEIQRKKDHYYYHCELNPDGFLKIKRENFDKEAMAKFQDEIKNLPNKAHKQQPS